MGELHANAYCNATVESAPSPVNGPQFQSENRRKKKVKVQYSYKIFLTYHEILKKNIHVAVSCVHTQTVISVLLSVVFANNADNKNGDVHLALPICHRGQFKYNVIPGSAVPLPSQMERTISCFLCLGTFSLLAGQTYTAYMLQ